MARKKKYRSAPPVEVAERIETPETPSPETRPDPEPLTRKQALVGLVVLLLLGLLLRVLHLTDLSLWMDEYVHVMRAKNFVEGDGPLLTDDNNGILLTLTLLPGFAAFGATVFWARFPSVLFGLGLVYMSYRIGARLFNRYVGLFAAAGATFSLYLIFWSRVCRNYAPLGMFYLLLGVVFLLAFESAQAKPEAPSFWVRRGISKRAFLWLPVVGLLTFLSHQLAFFFLFTIGVYSLVRLAGSYWNGTEAGDRPKWAWMSGLTLPLLLIVFVPPLGAAMKKMMAPFLLSNIADWAIPDWTRLAALTRDMPWDTFQLYHSLVAFDLNWLYLPALAGLVVAFWLRPHSGLWVICSLAVPFLLLSFVFREPSLRRYLIFVYPYFFIAAGVFFYQIWKWLQGRAPRFVGGLLLVAPFFLILGNVHWDDVADLALARKLEGHIVDQRIASWSFTNWKEACAYVERYRKPGDLMMSTVPTAVSYYMSKENVLWFRQVHYDTREKQYKLNEPDPEGKLSASTFEELVRTVESAPRGWLLADYYLENVFTDERALLWVYQNMHYYPDASMAGSLMVFGWDHSQPKPVRQNLVVELGCDDNKIESKDYHMTLPEALFTNDQIELTVRTRWVDTNREALVLFNGQNAVWLPPNQSSGVEEAVLPIQREWLRPGQNTIRILYETKRPSDPRKGFTMYFLSITGR